MAKQGAKLEGVLPVDKPAGPTSHDIVALARRRLGLRRVGHTGTLDPFASGLLLLCLGRATRLAEYLSGLSKTYSATALLGVVTATDDPEGAEVGGSDEWRSLQPDIVARAFEAQQGERLQVPPAFSAKKVAGERLYARARRGESVAPDPVRVRIHRLEVTRVALPEVGFDVECSSGTYIRSIARDAGEALGVGAHLTFLRRTAIGRFDVADALPAGELDDGAAARARLIDPLRALGHLPSVEVGDAAAAALAQGKIIDAPGGAAERGSGPLGAASGGELAVAHRGRLLAIASLDGGRLKPRKVFHAG